jgi:glycosyltransferase involved in cell wall biosynthesis
LPDYLRAMNVMVLPSYSTPTWKEQFAGGLLEAMACGTIAIGSTCGEIPNVLSDAGIVFPEDDAQTLADSLRHLQTDPMFRATLVQRGLERVRQQYTWSETARQTFSFWSELLSNG